MPNIIFKAGDRVRCKTDAHLIGIVIDTEKSALGYDFLGSTTVVVQWFDDNRRYDIEIDHIELLKPKLILTIGLPRSGKSNWARRQLGQAAIVCPDEIRLALHGQPYIKSAEPMVWATARLMVVALFGAGHQIVILDACSHTEERRKVWEDDRWTAELQPFRVPVQECRDRAKESGQDYLLPVIDRMYKEISFPMDLSYFDR